MKPSSNKRVNEAVQYNTTCTDDMLIDKINNWRYNIDRQLMSIIIVEF